MLCFLSLNGCFRHLHADIVARDKVLDRHIEQRLPHKPPTSIEDSSRDRRVLVLFLDFVESGFQAFRLSGLDTSVLMPMALPPLLLISSTSDS